MELSEEEKKAIEWLEKAEYFSARLYAPIILNLLNNYKKEIDREKQYSDFYKDLCNKQQKIIKELQKDKKVLIKNYDKILGTFISKETIRERIKHNEKQKNIVVSAAKFEINDDGIEAEGIEGLNDLIVYKSYEAVINELNYLLEENTLKENINEWRKESIL